jgi:hypothetical protein
MPIPNIWDLEEPNDILIPLKNYVATQASIELRARFDHTLNDGTSATSTHVPRRSTRSPTYSIAGQGDFIKRE